MKLARLVALACLLGGATSAWGDGGAVVARVTDGGWIVTVFAAPVPLRAGPADLSVLVQADDDEPVLDGVVTIELSSESGRRVVARADHAQATNRLLYAASVVIPDPGSWSLRVEVDRHGERAIATAALQVAEPSSPVERFWPWLALPPLAIAAFLLRQWLRDRGG